MNLRQIALQNLRRRKGKAALIVFGLVLGIGTVVTVLGFSEALTADINHKLEQYGANILIVPRTESLTLNYGGLAMGGVSFAMQELREEDLLRVQEIKNARNIAALGPMLLGAVRLGEREALLAGVDFASYRTLKPWWQVSGALPGPDGLLLGSEAARVLGLGPGQTVALQGRPLTVSGVLEPTGSQDDQLVFTPLATAQALLGKPGRVSLVEVAALCLGCPIPEMVAQLAAALPGAKVMAIQQVVEGRVTALAHFRKFSLGIAAIVILIGSLVVLVTMSGSVRERKAEIGIFRAVGFRRSHVARVILMEAALTSAAAGILGYAAGFGAIHLAVRLFAENPHHVAVPVNPAMAGAALALALGVGMAASLYPALMASRMDPNEALRAL